MAIIIEYSTYLFGWYEFQGKLLREPSGTALLRRWWELQGKLLREPSGIALLRS